MPKPILFLHLGPHKTGTTTIQHFLFENRKTLASQGLLYPLNTVKHLSLHKALKSHKLNDILNQIVLEFNQSSANKILISSESFSYLEGVKKKAEKFAKELNTHFEVKPIYIVRNHLNRFESHYIQKVKSGNLNLSISDFYLKYNFRLHDTLCFWANYFGKENLIIENFESIAGKDLPTKFLNLIGVEADHLSPINSKNEKPSLEQFWFIQQINSSVFKRFEAKKQIPPKNYLLRWATKFIEKTENKEDTTTYHLLPKELQTELSKKTIEENEKLKAFNIQVQDSKSQKSVRDASDFEKISNQRMETFLEFLLSEKSREILKIKPV